MRYILVDDSEAQLLQRISDISAQVDAVELALKDHPLDVKIDLDNQNRLRARHVFNRRHRCSDVDVDDSGLEWTYFADHQHLLHGSSRHALPFMNCTEIGVLLKWREKEGIGAIKKLTEGLKTFGRRCMKCHHEQPRSEAQFESQRQRYVIRNKLHTLQVDGIASIVNNRPVEEVLHRLNQESSPVITVGLAVCGRDIQRLEEYTLLTHAFPAYAQYLETGFEYWFILGADIGDPIFDVESESSKVVQRFHQTVGRVG